MNSRGYQENQAIIDHLERIHISFKSELGIKSKTRKWAVWQLQGASLALSYRAVQYQQKQEDMISILMLSRLSSEFLSQIGYLADPRTSALAVKKWQRVYNPLLGYPTTLDEIPYSDHKTRPNTSKNPKKMPDDIDSSFGAYNKKLNNIQSLWAHPSYDSTRKLFETDNNDGSYERYNFKNVFYSQAVADNMTEMIVDNSARAIHVGSYLYGKSISYRELLQSKEM